MSLRTMTVLTRPTTAQLRAWYEASASYTLPHARQLRPATAAGQLIHVATRARMPSSWLSDPRFRRIISREIAHYARACRIAVVHIALHRDTLHLIVQLRADSAPLHVMIGTLKAQCAKKLKRAMHVKPDTFALAGSLWRERYAMRILHEPHELGACIFYLYGRLISPRATQGAARRHGRLTSLVHTIWSRLPAAALGATTTSSTANLTQELRNATLTDGMDAQWRAHLSPDMRTQGWRAVSIGGRRRWMLATPGTTSPPSCPLWSALGANDAERWAVIEALVRDEASCG